MVASEGVPIAENGIERDMDTTGIRFKVKGL